MSAKKDWPRPIELHIVYVLQPEEYERLFDREWYDEDEPYSYLREVVNVMRDHTPHHLDAFMKE